MHALHLALAALGALANPQAAPYDENTLVVDIPNDWDVDGRSAPGWDRTLRNQAIEAEISLRRTRPFTDSVRLLAEKDAREYASTGAYSVTPVIGDALQACFDIRLTTRAPGTKAKPVTTVYRKCYRRMPKTHTSLVQFAGMWREGVDKAARRVFDAVVKNTRLE